MGEDPAELDNGSGGRVRSSQFRHKLYFSHQICPKPPAAQFAASDGERPTTAINASTSTYESTEAIDER